ncbi:MAG TPA: 6-bladed beta-propeller [Candidatus Baltobacteraceae bacterium]|nr:6-bladed beta-propeller [Candidatus Baltobacteraceae bacterium]
MKTNLPAKWIFAALAAALFASCATTPRVATEKSAPLVWPLPPDQPRIAYVRSLHNPRDIGQSLSFFTRIGHWLTGETGESLALQKPFGLALDETGNLCITDTGANLVCYLDFAHKKWRRYLAAGKTAFVSPVAVAKRNGIFYVADSALGEVLAFRDDGKSAFEITNSLVRPVGLAIDGNLLAVVDSQAHDVSVFDLAGKFLFKFGKRGTGPGEFNFPTHIASDATGRWLVTDSLNCRIQIFSADGKFISQFGSSGDTSGHFGRPKGVAEDSFGHIYVADAIFDNVQIFDASGQLLLNFGQSGAGAGEFGLPNGVVIAPDNTIYIADAYNHRVQIFKYLGGQ